MRLVDLGFVRVAAATPPVHLADPSANAQEIIAAARTCVDQGAAVVVFPEMSVSGYSLDDLVLQETLLDKTWLAIETLCQASATLGSPSLTPLLVVGAPLRLGNALYNCALYLHGGELLGVVPKSHLPSYREFYEKRYFSTLAEPATMRLGERLVPVGPVQVRARDIPGLQVAVDICEDMWVPLAPSSRAALQGATVIANLSASPVTVGRARRREDIIKAQSITTSSAYIYTAAGYGESSNDLAWDGQALIYEAGTRLAASPRFSRELEITWADVDLAGLVQSRRIQNSFTDNARGIEGGLIVEASFGSGPAATDLRRPLPRFPFVPDDPHERDNDCYEAFSIQVSALSRRIESIGSPKLVIGVSGGLDSTQALLVCAQAMDLLGRPRTDILAYTMPGFGTSARTRTNAERLAVALGTTFAELDIRPTASQMLKTMGHAEDDYDVTFENVQAGLRTDYLFRLANQHGGIVVGTGDLSELALGWCTYGVGDQMSHYAINAGLPKTMIQHLIRWVSGQERFGGDLSLILEDILATEISPELVPGATLQSTQAIIGPYSLQDFTLYHLLHNGAGPKRIAFLAGLAWPEYSRQEILKWLRVFHRRFFANQFKRTALPNGPKMMGAGALSPRGDWRMPSDALAASWLGEIEELEAEE